MENQAKKRENNEKMIEIDKIIRVVAEVYEVSVADIMSESRKRMIVEARQMAMYLTRQRTNCSLVDIGNMFKREYPSVIHSIQKVEGMLQFDKLTKRNYELIKERL